MVRKPGPSSGAGVTLSEAEESIALIQRVLAGDQASVRTLLHRLEPVIMRRVATALWRSGGEQRVAQAAEDLAQDVLVSLFQSDHKALRAWDPTRGMSLESFVGLLAKHQVSSFLRNRKTTPWREEPTDGEQLERIGAADPSPEAVTAAREDLRIVLDRLRDGLTPRGLELFQRIIVDEEPLEALIESTGMTSDAIYQWKTRILRTARALAAELRAFPVSERSGGLRMAEGAPKT